MSAILRYEIIIEILRFIDVKPRTINILRRTCKAVNNAITQAKQQITEAIQTHVQILCVFDEEQWGEPQRNIRYSYYFDVFDGTELKTGNLFEGAKCLKDCIIYSTVLNIPSIVYDNSQRAILDPQAEGTFRHLFYRDNIYDKEYAEDWELYKKNNNSGVYTHTQTYVMSACTISFDEWNVYMTPWEPKQN